MCVQQFLKFLCDKSYKKNSKKRLKIAKIYKHETATKQILRTTIESLLYKSLYLWQVLIGLRLQPRTLYIHSKTDETKIFAKTLMGMLSATKISTASSIISISTTRSEIFNNCKTILLKVGSPAVSRLVKLVFGGATFVE